MSADPPEPGAPPQPLGWEEPPRAVSSDSPEEPGPDAAEGAATGHDLPLSDSFLTIWLQPRDTIRRIVRRNPRYFVIALAAIAGITSSLSSMPGRSGGAEDSVRQLLLVAFLAGPLLGLLGVFLGGWLVRLTGRWLLEGRGGAREVRAALAWGELPGVVALPLWLLATAAFGTAVLAQRTFDLVGASPVYALFAISIVGLRTWGLILTAHTVAEVQGYRSAWKGLLNLLLAVLLIGLVAGAAVVGIMLVLGFDALRLIR